MGTTDLGFESDVRIGASIATMETVKVEPFVELYHERVEKLVCGEIKAVGYPRCRWTYPGMQLEGEQYNQLKTLVGQDLATSVYIDIPGNDVSGTTYLPLIATYQAVMNWPSEGVKRIHYNRWEIPDEGIVFTNLEPQ